MAIDRRQREELLAEIEDLRLRLQEAEDVLQAIHRGEVDAIVVSGPEKDRIFTLKGAEQPYRMLVESMNEGAATLHPDRTIIFSNVRLAEMLRIPLEKLIGSDFTGYVAPADTAAFAAVLGSCAVECSKEEITLISATGTELPVQLSCCPIDADGVEGVSLVITDLSDQKRNEVLSTAERLARSILFQVGEAILVCDPAGRIIRASRVAVKLCGKNPLRRPFDKVLSLRLPDKDRFFSVAEPISGRPYENVEVSFERSDGRTYNLVLNATALTDRKGQILGCVVTLTDFTGRKQAEEDLRRSEEQFRLLADMMPAFVWTTTPEGVIDYVNRQFLEYTGADPANISEGYSFPVHPDDRAATDAAYHHALRMGEPYEMEHRLKRFDGVYRWYLCRSTPVRDAAGRIIKWYGSSTDIHDLRETQDRLRESEAKFRWLFDSNLISTFFWQTTGRVVEANQAFCSLIGCTLDEVGSGKVMLQDATPQELMPRDYAAWEEVRAHGFCQPYEKEFINRADGRRVPVLISGGLLAGSSTDGIGFAIDLSERKQVEEALRSSEATLKLAIESTAIGTFDYYPQSGELIWSDMARLHFGLPPGAPVDYSVFLAGLHPEDTEYVHMMVQSALKGDNDGEHRIEYRTVGLEDRQERWLAVRGKVFFNDQGEAVRFIGTTLDITERKRVEEELRLATEELERRVAARTSDLAALVATLQEEATERIAAEESVRSSERLLKTVLDTLPVAVWVLDGKGEVVAVNPAGKSVWSGQGFREGAPEVYRGWRHDTGEPIPYGEWGSSRAVTRGETILGEEYDIQCFDGSRKTILYSAVPLRDEKGEVVGAVVVNEDITTRVESERALQVETAERLRALEELRRKDRLLMQQSRLAAMGEMIGNIAHQWRQPLNTIGLIVQGLALGYETGNFDKEFLDSSTARAMQVITHMSRTIDDFRNFFRPGKEKVPFKVNEVVANTVSLVDASFRDLQLHIDVAVADELVIYGYPNEYSQVLLNILLNARDAIVEREVAAPRVGIAVARHRGKAVVTITDNAGGIPEKIMDKIFDPYFTTKGPDKGTGIGLFMAKNIIENNMNGMLTVRNTEDGAEFRIEIPEHQSS